MVDGTSITDAALARKLEGAAKRDPSVKIRISHVAKARDRAAALRELAKRAGATAIEVMPAIETTVPPSPPPASDTTPVTVLTIDAKGALFLGARKVEAAALDKELAALAKRTKKIALRPDGGTPYGTIQDLMDRCKAAGLTDIMFLAN